MAVFFGWIGSKFLPRRALLLTGLVMLTAATTLLAIGRHAAILIIGRIAQGFSASIVWTNGLALLVDAFGKERFGEILGYVQSSVSVGTTGSPILGGLVYARGGYSAVSLMTVGTTVINVILMLIMVEPKTDSEDGKAVPTNSDPGADSGRIIPDEEVDCEGRKPLNTNKIGGSPKHPDERQALIQKDDYEETASSEGAYIVLLRSKRILVALWGIFIYASLLVSFDSMIPLFVKETFNWNSARAGLTFLSWVVPGFLAPLAGKLSDKYGPRWIAAGGFLAAVVPLVFLRFISDNNTPHKIYLCTLMVLTSKLPLTCALRICCNS